MESLVTFRGSSGTAEKGFVEEGEGKEYGVVCHVVEGRFWV